MATSEQIEIQILKDRLAAYETMAAQVALVVAFCPLQGQVNFSNSDASGLAAVAG